MLRKAIFAPLTFCFVLVLSPVVLSAEENAFVKFVKCSKRKLPEEYEFFGFPSFHDSEQVALLPLSIPNASFFALRRQRDNHKIAIVRTEVFGTKRKETCVYSLHFQEPEKLSKSYFSALTNWKREASDAEKSALQDALNECEKEMRLAGEDGTQWVVRMHKKYGAVFFKRDGETQWFDGRSFLASCEAAVGKFSFFV